MAQSKHHMSCNIEGLLRNFKRKKINFLECELLFFSVNEIKILISNILDNPSLVKPKVEYLKDYNLDNRYLNNYLTRDKNYQGYY